MERAEREKLISATKSDVKVQHNDTSYSKILEEKVELEIKLAGAMSTIAKLKGFDFNDAPKQKDLYISELESQLAKSQKRLKDTEEDLEVTQTKLSDTTVLLEDAEEQIKAKDARIAELEVGPTDVPSPATENSVPAEGGTTRWQSSVEAVCKAIIEVCRSGRTDWVSGQHAAETTDSTGQETFNALLTRMYDGERAVMAQAERAAWRVLAGSGFKRGAGRPSNK